MLTIKKCTLQHTHTVLWEATHPHSHIPTQCCGKLPWLIRGCLRFQTCNFRGQESSSSRRLFALFSFSLGGAVATQDVGSWHCWLLFLCNCVVARFDSVVFLLSTWENIVKLAKGKTFLVLVWNESWDWKLYKTEMNIMQLKKRWNNISSPCCLISWI